MLIKYSSECFYDGDVIEIKDKNGKIEYLPEGIGIYISLNGEKYEGFWKNGKRCPTLLLTFFAAYGILMAEQTGRVGALGKADGMKKTVWTWIPAIIAILGFLLISVSVMVAARVTSGANIIGGPGWPTFWAVLHSYCGGVLRYLTVGGGACLLAASVWGICLAIVCRCKRR